VEKGEQDREELQLTSTTVIQLMGQQLSKKLDKLQVRYAGLQPAGHRTHIPPCLEMTRWLLNSRGQALGKVVRLTDLPYPAVDDGLLPELLSAFDGLIGDSQRRGDSTTSLDTGENC